MSEEVQRWLHNEFHVDEQLSSLHATSGLSTILTRIGLEVAFNERAVDGRAPDQEC